MVKDKNIDAVPVFTEGPNHVKHILECLKHGKHGKHVKHVFAQFPPFGDQLPKLKYYLKLYKNLV
ncbi:MAG: hypothetical protein ACJAVY_000623 [Marinoscillum sp.]